MLTVYGYMKPGSFIRFINDRAHRLSLAVQVNDLSDSHVSASATGPAALVDAFEMTCSLGPADCIVLDVTRSPARASATGRDPGQEELA